MPNPWDESYFESIRRRMSNENRNRLSERINEQITNHITDSIVYGTSTSEIVYRDIDTVTIADVLIKGDNSVKKRRLAKKTLKQFSIEYQPMSKVVKNDWIQLNAYKVLLSTLSRDSEMDKDVRNNLIECIQNIRKKIKCRDIKRIYTHKKYKDIKNGRF